ncbi:hypothetical protein CDCA_CDCA15G4021 [Cyanidium caldarium]|uniref:adenosylmethionine decarboxylase n=1 Tax=Cyanidium caldarium TaxID=2771 RepID=A0AAV9J0S9_CYACA|nr:hypothetical protein CDCA_CDCA15G4021 [Cyanidium caldarium]
MVLAGVSGSGVGLSARSMSMTLSSPLTTAANMACSAPSAGFEGPEKKLEIRFVPLSVGADGEGGDAGSLRTASRDEWEELLQHAQCSVLSVVHNAHCDAYLLSESSLFVYDRQLLVKTCGTTALLTALPLMLSLAARRRMKAASVQYSRVPFLYPAQQPYPHTSFADEVAYLRGTLPHGSAYAFHGDGVVSSDVRSPDVVWHLFTYDRQSPASREQRLEVCMFDLDPERMRAFYEHSELHDGCAWRCTAVSGLQALLEELCEMETPPSSSSTDEPLVIDAHLFSPCGYSMNAVHGDTYFTVHITPEPHCSYVSFESNIAVSTYAALLRQVLDTFRPGRFSLCAVADAPASTTGDASWTLLPPPQLPAADDLVYVSAMAPEKMRVRGGQGEHRWSAGALTYRRMTVAPGSASRCWPWTRAARLRPTTDGWASPVSGAASGMSASPCTSDNDDEDVDAASGNEV